ncbi:MAG: glutamate-5-semialdehyde dehydrogenase [Kiritimatiellae bacterium]|nr:glutamate-5-semialdehyde dehydrogenase [Kiritimatiellia bacterium]
METAAYIRDMATRARSAAAELAKMTTDEKNAALLAIADALEAHRGEIAAANAADVARAKENGISPSMLDRLTLTPARFDAMVAGVRHVASLPDPVGETIWTRERPSGIKIRKVRVPLGVIAVVFESRPNVFVDTAALCLKTGNAVILRGGKEAIESNKALAAAVHSAMKGDAIQLVEILDHAAVTELVRAVGLVDVAIPRGGERLIRAMCEAALVPVLKHYKGVCHIYVDDKADLAMALAILDNAKTQRPGVCNAAECLLVHEKLAPMFMPMVEAWAKDKGVTLHENEPGTEYLSLDINVAKVADYRAAIDFINKNSSHHSECIVTNDERRAAEFLRDVDSAAVYHNVSTRFTDGGEFGMGAEIGISTDKLHARGPMGLEELTTYKYTITGDGVVRK